MTPRARFEKWAESEGYNTTYTKFSDNKYYFGETQNAWVGWQAALATRPDVNQELVEALEEVERSSTLPDGDTINTSTALWLQDLIAKHKVGKTSGFTEDELIEIVYKKVHPTNGAIRATITALKASGALRLKGE